MIELILGVTLLLSNAFWAWQVQRLVSKLMSRSFIEFKEGELAEKRLEAKSKVNNQPYFDDSEMGSVTEIMQ